MKLCYHRAARFISAGGAGPKPGRGGRRGQSAAGEGFGAGDSKCEKVSHPLGGRGGGASQTLPVAKEGGIKRRLSEKFSFIKRLQKAFFLTDFIFLT